MPSKGGFNKHKNQLRFVKQVPKFLQNFIDKTSGPKKDEALRGLKFAPDTARLVDKDEMPVIANMEEFMSKNKGSKDIDLRSLITQQETGDAGTTIESSGGKVQSASSVVDDGKRRVGAATSSSGTLLYRPSNKFKSKITQRKRERGKGGGALTAGDNDPDKYDSKKLKKARLRDENTHEGENEDEEKKKKKKNRKKKGKKVGDSCLSFSFDDG